MQVSEAGLDAMEATMVRRGPDGSGRVTRDGCTLLHRRLVVIDPAGGKQPMTLRWNGEQYHLVYNGELYNTEELTTIVLRSARILGVKEQLISYHSDGAAQHAAEEALLSVGWRCILPESPETFAVMRRGVLLFPVVLTLEKEDEQMTLGLYTARSALCVVNLRRVLKKWLEAVPLELKPITSTAEPGEGKKEA